MSFSLSKSKKSLNLEDYLYSLIGFKLIFSNIKFIESAGMIHGKMSDDYYVILTNPATVISLGVNIENLATTLFIADAKNNIVFFTDDNILYMKPIKETFNSIYYNMVLTITSIDFDDMLRIIVVGTISTIQVFPYDI
jgi:hypothetical protein